MFYTGRVILVNLLEAAQHLVFLLSKQVGNDFLLDLVLGRGTLG